MSYKAEKMFALLSDGERIENIPYVIQIMELFDWSRSELMDQLRETIQKERKN